MPAQRLLRNEAPEINRIEKRGPLSPSLSLYHSVARIPYFNGEGQRSLLDKLLQMRGVGLLRAMRIYKKKWCEECVSVIVYKEMR